MENVVQSLIYAVSYLELTKKAQDNPALVLVCGAYSPLFSSSLGATRFYSPFAGERAKWEKANHAPFQLEDNTTFDLILIQAPQQKDEMDFLIAHALKHIKPDGIVMIAADNQVGGKTLDRRLTNFGCTTSNLSKHKARVVWTREPKNIDPSAVETAIKAGAPQPRPADSLLSQPGIFSWDRRDKGTEVLLKYLPNTLSGKGADLGCGLGEIGKYILEQCPTIHELTSIDHDQRSIDCCKKNLAAFAQKTRFLCQDIPTETNLTGLDFIVMNPPFHIGKKESHDLGKAFINKARQALKEGGKLYLVANTHLPYEDELKSLFSKTESLAVENGFKVIMATK